MTLYHFTESGLDNVWLKNGFTQKDTPFGPAVSFAALDQLLDEIAAHLVRKPGRLSGKEFRYLRSKMHLSQTAMAKLQGVSEQNISLWERRGRVPKSNDTLQRLLYLKHASGDESLKSAFERIMTVERLVHQKIVATAGRNGWKFKVEETERESEEQAVGA
jgi:DNA-binding transcriptional regulator YiaG